MEKQLISFKVAAGKLKAQGYLWQLVSKVLTNPDGTTRIATVAIVEDCTTHQLRQAELTEFTIENSLQQ